MANKIWNTYCGLNSHEVKFGKQFVKLVKKHGLQHFYKVENNWLYVATSYFGFKTLNLNFCNLFKDGGCLSNELDSLPDKVNKLFSSMRIQCEKTEVNLTRDNLEIEILYSKVFDNGNPRRFYFVNKEYLSVYNPMTIYGDRNIDPVFPHNSDIHVEGFVLPISPKTISLTARENIYYLNSMFETMAKGGE